MELSSDLISQFVKITQDKQEPKKESTAYGKIVKQGDTVYVQLDGSDLLTPITSTTVVKDGDRVLVSIKDHTAIVTGDITNPSANNSDVTEIGNKISEFEIVIADKVSTKQLEAEIAKIDKLIADNIDAVNGKFETIEAKVAEIDTIKADIIEVKGKITAHEGEFTTIRAEIAEFKNVVTESIEAVTGEFHQLESDYADFKVTTTDKLLANEASIKKLKTEKLDATEAELKYANIDFANITEAAIEKLFTDSGIIKDLIMSEGKVTGELIGVTIKGDLIEAATLKADRLVIKGEDGLYYQLNVNALGETTASSDEKYQNGIDGTNIIAQSITADRIAVTDLVAFGATIGGYHIDDHALYSGVKSTIDNTTRGVFLGDDGQFAVGNSNNFLKFYKDVEGNYKLEIKANNIKFGSTGETIEETIKDLVKSTEVQYYLSNSPTELSGGTWQNTAPEWVNGKYMWSRTKLTRQSGTVQYVPSENGTCISGAQGPQGEKGDTGDDGNGVASTVVEYQTSASGTVKPTGNWLIAVPKTTAEKPYLWTRTTITYTDGEKSYVYSVGSTPEGIVIGGRNYIHNGSGKEQKGFFENFDFINDDGYCMHKFVSTGSTKYIFLNNGFVLGCRDYKVGAKVVFSYDIMYTEWNIPEGTKVKTLIMGQRYGTQATEGGPTDGELRSVTMHILPRIDRGECELNKWCHVEKVFTIPEQAAEGINTHSFIAYASTTADIESSITFELKNVKIEYGTKATDWTPAPEDIDSDIDDINSGMDDLNSNINDVNDNLSNEISNVNDQLTNDMSELQKTLRTEFEQTNEGWNFQFNEIIKQISNIDGEMNANYSELIKYIRFVDGTIELGIVGNEITLKLRNDRLLFLQNDAEVAYMSNGRIYITDGEFLKSLIIGNFAFQPRSNGSLSFNKIKK